ncbi:MAG TPA: universal stress protein [Polyangiaceae bacterium]|nr:universal stress protein [Polyangiaceae bacterium]
MSSAIEVTTSLDGSACPAAGAPPVRHALVCLDRSPFSDSCLRQARFIAEALGTKLTLLHVMPSPQGKSEASRADALDWQIGKREIAQYLADTRDSLGPLPGEVVTELTQGYPAEQIVAMAREIGADLTILSSRGESGEDGCELGSTAQHVFALAPGSVLLAQPTGSANVPPRRLLVALDGSTRSECVLPLVTELARHDRAEVLLVHVVTDPTPTAVLSDADDVRLAHSLASRVQANAERYLSRVRTRLLRDVPLVQTLVLLRAEERQALLDVAGQTGADMLVLTAHGSTCNAERTFGSVASYLLAHAELPLFVFQDMPRGDLDPVHTNGQHHVARVPLSVRPPEGD